MGSLCLKYKDIYLKDDRKAVERVLCMNAGDEPLTVGVDTALLPPFLEVSVEPETIPPGGEADIVVRYDPSAATQGSARDTTQDTAQHKEQGKGRGKSIGAH